MLNKYSHYGVGLDLSKSDFQVCVGAQLKQGGFKVVGTKKFKNTNTGFTDFIEWLKKQLKEEIRVRMLLEVTGVYHENLLYFLYEKGFNVCLEQGHRVKKYLSVLGYKSKTDKLDGKGMSQMACERELKTWKPASESILHSRSILRLRKSLLASKGQMENRLHAIKHSHVQDKFVVKALKRMIKKAGKEIDKCEEEAMKLAKQDASFFEKVEMIVSSVKGLGYLTVLTVVSETNGFETFTSRKQLESYSGYDVVENSSGQFTGKTRISKKGNANIRGTLYMAALSAIRAKARPFYDLYARLVVRNGGIKKKANVAVQRKLLLIIYTLWKKNEPFSLNYYMAA